MVQPDELLLFEFSPPRARSAWSIKFCKILKVWRNAVTKRELILEVAGAGKLTQKQSEVIVEAIFDRIVREVRSGKQVEIRGFGSFVTAHRKAREIRNPQNGEPIEVPAKQVPSFKPSKELKAKVAGRIPAALAPSRTRSRQRPKT